MGSVHAEIARVARQRETVAAGEHHVEDRELEIRRPPSSCRPSAKFSAVDDLVAGVPQVDRHELAHQALVFDDGDAISHAHALGRHRELPTAAQAAG